MTHRFRYPIFCRAAALAVGLAAVGLPLALAEETKLSQHQLDEEYARAVVLLSLGQFDAAEQTVGKLLARVPGEARLVYLQRQVGLARQAADRDRPQRDLKDRLNRIVFPKVTFRNAAAADVIEWLRVEGRRLAAGGEPVNLVWMVPADTTLPGVTLQLQNVPLLEVIRYTALTTGLQYRVESHAVVIYLPAESMPPPTAPDDGSQ